jgi:hypothetical protein
VCHVALNTDWSAFGKDRVSMGGEDDRRSAARAFPHPRNIEYVVQTDVGYVDFLHVRGHIRLGLVSLREGGAISTK